MKEKEMNSTINSPRELPEPSSAAQAIKQRFAEMQAQNSQALDELQAARDQTWVDLMVLDETIARLRDAKAGYNGAERLTGSSGIAQGQLASRG